MIGRPAKIAFAGILTLANCGTPPSSDSGERRAAFASVDRLPAASQTSMDMLEQTLLACLAKAGFPDMVAYSGTEDVRRQGCSLEYTRTAYCQPVWYTETVRWIAIYPSTVTNPELEPPAYTLQVTPRSQYYTDGYLFYDWSDPTQPLPSAVRSTIMNLVGGAPAC